MPLWHNIAELVDYYIPPLPSVYWIDIMRELQPQVPHVPPVAGTCTTPGEDASGPVSAYCR